MKLSATLCVTVCALCVSLSAPSSFAAESPAPELDPTLVAVIADTHVNGLPAERLPEWCGGYSHQAGCLRKTVEEILALRPLPANVIGLGDYAFLWGMREDYALVAELLAPLERAGIRVTLAMGDHDRRDNFLAQWPHYAENAPVPGRILSKVETPHCEILLADTVNDDPVRFGEGARPGHVDDAQRSWLEAELKAADKPVIVCGHHGPREGNVNLSKMLLAAPACKAYFHGHWHRWSPGFERVPGKGLLPRYTLPSTGHWGDIGFVLLRTYPDHAVLELHQLDWFGEAGPGSGGAFRDALLKDRAGEVTTIPFREAFAASIAAGEPPAPRHGAAAAGISGGVGGPPAEPHGAAAASPYGVCSHLTWGEFSARDRTFSLCRVAGLGTVRCDFTWSMVEKPKGSWDFSRTDVIVADAKAAGVAILPILYWDKNDYPKPHVDPDPWRDYIRHVAERYAADIPVFEIWNEQDLRSKDNVGNPTNYLAVLKSAYETIKAAAPGARVAIGGFGEADGKHTPLGYIEELYKLGGGAYFDIMNIHPYSVPFGPEGFLLPNLENLRALMAKYGDAEKPIWITEIGWPTNERKPGFDPKKGDKWHYMGGVSEAFSAICLSRALGIAFAEGVEMFMPYELRDREFEQYNNEAHYGLCRNNFVPKPAFAAYSAFTAMRPVGSVQKSDRPWHDGDFFFPQWRRPADADAKREGKPLGADAGMLWTSRTDAGDRRILRFTSDAMRFFDHLGAEVWPKPKDGGYEMEVTDKPVFFVGGELSTE